MRKNIEHKEYTLLYDACMHVKLISDFETINKKVDFMAEISSEDFLPLNQKLRLYQKRIDSFTNDEKLDKRLAASGVYGSISALIKDMQFHDIIQQRLDHIRKINQDILEELKDISYDPMYLSKTKYIKVITHLSRINAVQIQVINQEYKSVIDNLKKTLDSMNNLLNVETNPTSIYCFSNVALFNILADTISSKLKSISKMVYPGHTLSNLQEEMDEIQKVYTMKTERDIFSRVLELTTAGYSMHTINLMIMKELKDSVSDNRLELF
ncbi:MAG TPA: hypothetical protein VNB90_04710 [Cytophagaceae bacterium]|nr:hypothetical protein [Cytophagaceae bacterium]